MITSTDYIAVISREPTADMIKLGQGYKYIPKSILQIELLNIFEGNTKWEMLRDTVSKNGLWGTGLLHYKHPATGEWLYVSGTASIPHLKKMQLNYPALEAQCFKNACKKIGVWFGQTLNLDAEDLPIEELEQTDPTEQQETEQFLLLKLAVTNAPTKEAAQKIINESGNWKIPLTYQTKDIVNQKP